MPSHECERKGKEEKRGALTLSTSTAQNCKVIGANGACNTTRGRKESPAISGRQKWEKVNSPTKPATEKIKNITVGRSSPACS